MSLCLNQSARQMRSTQSTVVKSESRPDRQFRITATEADLAARVIEAHLVAQSAIASQSKDLLRAMHINAKLASNLGTRPERLAFLLAQYGSWLKDGPQIEPSAIRPSLRIVNDPLTEGLWTIARACWSMPFNKGYGRRLRFVIIDEAHDALIGIIGLQSPPADLACRDIRFDYPTGRKLELVNQTMDAFAVGALPPYSYLLGGKLCAGLISTNTVREAYWRAYAGKRSLLELKRLGQPLVAVSTTSAFGRSSLYNRLNIGPRKLAECIGETKGFGLVHLEHLYPEIEKVLLCKGLFTPAGFGNGPKVRWQNVSVFLRHVGLPKMLLHHGLNRPVYWFPFFDELEQGMSGGSFGNAYKLSEQDFSSYWRERWAIPRSERFPHWRCEGSKRLIELKIYAESRVEN